MEARRLLAATPQAVQLVSDLDPRTASVGDFTTRSVALNGIVYFVGSNKASGWGIWRSDNTAAGTSLTDFFPGYLNSAPQSLTSLNGNLYFFGPTQLGERLFKSDGTVAGTVALASMTNYTSFSSNFYGGVGNLIYFVKNTNNAKSELWRTDGTAAGTFLLKSFAADVGPAQLLVNYHGQTYFSANDGITGVQLWRTDGSVTGTSRFTDVNSEELGMGSATATVFNDRLYFHASRDLWLADIWSTDGTTEGTRLEYEGYTVDAMAATASKLYFIDGGDLFASDGTPGEFDVVASLSGNGSWSNFKFTVVGNNVLFDYGNGLWWSDGTQLGTKMLVNAPAGTAGPYSIGGTTPSGRVFFRNYNSGEGNLWVTDGTLAGTFALTTGSGIISIPGVVGESAFFIKDSPVIGREPWKSDGTVAGTSLIVDANDAPFNSSPDNLTACGSSLFFTATMDSVSGLELYRTDLLTNQTTLVKDLYPGSVNSSPKNLIAVGGTLYFTASTTSGLGLFKTDGTASGTVQVASGLFNYAHQIAVDGTLYFTASTQSSSGYGLYKIASGGASLISGLPGATSGSGWGNETLRFKDALYFTVKGAEGIEPWTYDLLASGAPTLLRDINVGSDSTPHYFATVEDEFFFVASEKDHPSELWKSDGTTAGTVVVKENAPNFSPSSLTAFGSELLFIASNSTHPDSQLWRSDGTTAGTYAFAELGHDSSRLSAAALTNMGDYLLFQVTRQSNSARELWRTDGTAAGTFRVTSIGRTANPELFVRLGSRVYFSAYDGPTGTELWATDGSAAGTFRLADLNPGVANSQPYSAAVAGNELYFAATDKTHGKELFTVVDAPVYLAGTTLVISGTSGADQFRLSLSTDHSSVLVERDGSVLATVEYAAVSKIVFSGFDGDDVVTLADTFTMSIAYSGGRGFNSILAESNNIPPSIDLSSDALIVTYATDSPIGTWNGLKYSSITGLIQSGRNGGTWNGAGVTTSVAPLASAGMTIGVAEAADVLGLAGTQSALWRGQTVDSTTVVVAYTFAGDANLDGVINGDDYFNIDAGFASESTGYANGDFDYNGRIDADDYFLIDSNYNKAQVPAALSAIEIPQTSIQSATTESAYERLLDESRGTSPLIIRL